MGGVVQYFVGEVERFEDFKGAGIEAVGVARFGGSVVLVDAEAGGGGEAEAGEEEVEEKASGTRADDDNFVVWDGGGGEGRGGREAWEGLGEGVKGREVVVAADVFGAVDESHQAERRENNQKGHAEEEGSWSKADAASNDDREEQ